MKKLFVFAAALMMGTSMFASLEQEPSNETLESYAEAGQNLVYAIYVEDSIKCNDIVLVGTYNGWTADAASCSTFVAVEGFAGWYVCCVKDETDPDDGKGGIQAKPVQLDGAGAFKWDYQVGQLDQTAVVRGTATIAPGYTGECNITDISDATPLKINVSSWKNNPCTAVYHDYVITLISPDCNEKEYITPAISGGFNGWAQDSMAFDQVASATRYLDQLPGAVYTYTAHAAEGTEYKFRSAASWGADWSNELRQYVDSIEDWAAFNGGNNFVFGTTVEIEYDLGDPTKYSWTSCERPREADSADFVVTLTIPAFCTELAVYADSVQIVGAFDNWAGTPMTLVSENVYTATVRALEGTEYKFKAGAGWNVEIMQDAETGMPNIKFPYDQTEVNIDYSKQFWKGCPADVENVFENTTNNKVIIDGQLMILVNGVYYNVMGTQVK